MLKKVYLTKIPDSDHLRKHITSHCVEIDGNTDLFHQVNLNFVKRIQIYIDNDGQHVEII